MAVYICPEMKKLRDALDAAKIRWVDTSYEGYDETPGTCGTFIFVGRKKWSVINGYGTYGGIHPPNPENKGLLEVWDKTTKTDPVGWLTAEAVLKFIGINPVKKEVTKR